MHKKLLAGLIVIIFVLGSASTLNSASAHFTLGDYRPGRTANDRLFHENDFDPHVPGPLAYIWPGSGLTAFTGTPAGFPPGYQSPYPGGNPLGQPSSVYQLEGSAYAPFGAILTSTDDHQNRGPLILALNFSRPCEIQGVTCDTSGKALAGSRLFNYSRITVYIPPEFELNSNTGLISTTFSSDISLSKSSGQDPIGPGWWVLKASGNIQFWPQHDYAEWYYIRINDVVAPKIAGKYFFKVFLWDSSRMNVPGAWNSYSQITGGQVRIPTSGPTGLTVPVENWPVLLVKGEVDPAIVTGTIRYGTFNSTIYSWPINLPGRVRVLGVAIDPYTGTTTGRTVEARGYFNASAGGHYEVEGVAPGLYTVYASAAGYPEQSVASDIMILSGQSLHLDGYLKPGAVVHGQIFSKHMFGEEPWPSDPRPVLVEIYDSNDYADSSVAAWSPWNKTHAPYMSYDWPQESAVPEPLPVAYPWDAVAPHDFSYYSRVFSSPQTGQWMSHSALACGDGPTASRNADPCGKPDGVGPAQFWWVDGSGTFTNGGGPTSFVFQFGVKGLYGTPTEYDGHIPQSYATWVNGLTAGRYWVRAWINGYTQTLQDGITLDEYYFEVAKEEWAGDIFLSMDLRVGSTVVATVHFHDRPDTLQECPINGCSGNIAQGYSTGNRYMIVEARDSNGNLMGLNFTYVSSSESNATVQVNGFGLFGPDPNRGNMKFSYYRYLRTYRDYGLPSGTYRLYIYMRGYLPQNYEQVSLTLSGAKAFVSSHLYRGARFNVTAYSVDWEHPRVTRPWEFPGVDLSIHLYQNGVSISTLTPVQPAGIGGSLIGGGCSLAPDDLPDHCQVIEWDGSSTADDDGPDSHVLQGYDPLDQESGGFLRYPSDYRLASLNSSNAFDTGTYSFAGYTYGYILHKQPSTYAQRGGFTDIKMDLVKGVNMTINVVFKKEGVFAATEFNMTMRVRIFDQYGKMVATAQTKTPGSTTYNNGQPLGIGRNGQDGGTYYVDPYANSPSVTNGLTAIDAGSDTGDTFLWHGTWNDVTGWQAFDSDVNHDGTPDFSWFNSNYYGYNAWIPAGTDQVRILIAGLYTSYGINGYSPWADAYVGDWTVEVDTSNEYPTPKIDSTAGAPLKTNWYPPSPPNLEGLLEGDRFHTILGHPAGPFGYTGDGLRANGLGPYAQRSVWQIPNARLGSEVSATFELDKRGFNSGNVYGFTWSDELRTQSWITAEASTTNGSLVFTQYSWDAHYEMYLDQGDYNLRIIAWDPNGNQGYTTTSSALHVSDGQSASMMFQLEESKTAIPEFEASRLSMLAIVAASLFLLRWKRSHEPSNQN